MANFRCIGTGFLASAHIHLILRIRGCRAADLRWRLILLLLLRDDLSSVELDKHRSVGFQFFHRNRQTEIVQQQELQLKVVEFNQRKSPHLRYKLTPARG